MILLTHHRKRPGSPCPNHDYPKKGKPIAERENLFETAKLLRMVKMDSETMTSYYHQLIIQAEKCNINCCQDRIIRDLLIRAIVEDDILEEITAMFNPTAEDVMAKYNEIVQDMMQVRVQGNNIKVL